MLVDFLDFLLISFTSFLFPVHFVICLRFCYLFCPSLYLFLILFDLFFHLEPLLCSYYTNLCFLCFFSLFLLVLSFASVCVHFPFTLCSSCWSRGKQFGGQCCSFDTASEPSGITHCYLINFKYKNID